MTFTIQGYGGLFSAAAMNCGISSYGSGTSSPNGGDDQTGAAGVTADTVRMSSEGYRLASSLLDDIILPSAANVRRLSAALADDLGHFFSEAGISRLPPVEIVVDGNGAGIRVGGNRSDSLQIQDLIESDERIASQIRDIAAISSHAVAMADSMKFQKAYRASNDPGAVVARYAYLFDSGRSSSDISLVFNGSDIWVMSDGKLWVSSAG